MLESVACCCQHIYLCTQYDGGKGTGPLYHIKTFFFGPKYPVFVTLICIFFFHASLAK